MTKRFTSHAQSTEELRLTPGITKIVDQAAADTAEALDSSVYIVDGEKPVAALISVTTNNVHYAYNVDPVEAGLGHLGLEGSEIILQSTDEIEDFRFINAVALEQVTLTVTYFYRKTT